MLKRVKPRTYANQSYFIKLFGLMFGTKKARDIRKPDIEVFIAAHPWNESTEHFAKVRLNTMFRWAVSNEYLDRNPIEGIRKPRARSRGAHTLIDRGDYECLIENAEPCFRDVLIALWNTGARPSEVQRVRARDFDERAGIWRLPENKVEGTDRIIYLNEMMVEMSKRLSTRYPEGPIFRTQSGTPYGHCGMSKRLSWLCARLNIEGVILYGFRHTFATEALSRGIPDTVVAELLGHKGTTTLHKHYAHLVAKSNVMRDAINRLGGSE